jgi:ABC-type uncharacterized transport system substrate-binding protein
VLLAKELVELRPAAIFGVTTSAVAALTHETKTVPIVFAVVSDPIGTGFAASLAHPGGNVTGFTFVESAIGGKWVELLKEIAPRTERVALLFNPATAAPLQFCMSSIQSAASSFAIQTSATPIHTKDEIEGVIAAQARNPGGGLIVMPDPFNAANRDLIVAAAARHSVQTRRVRGIRRCKTIEVGSPSSASRTPFARLPLPTGERGSGVSAAETASLYLPP